MPEILTGGLVVINDENSPNGAAPVHRLDTAGRRLRMFMFKIDCIRKRQRFWLKYPQRGPCIRYDLPLGLVAGVVRHSLQAFIDCGFSRLNLSIKFVGKL